MLKVINSLSEYNDLYNKYVGQRKLSGYTNFFVNKDKLTVYIVQHKIKYAVLEDVLFLFVDQDEFYKMYFLGLHDKVNRIPKADKSICCDIYEQHKNDTHIKYIHEIFQNNQFIIDEAYEQVRLSYGSLNKIVSKYLNKNIKKLKKENLVFSDVRLEDCFQVETLIKENMGIYNKLSIEDESLQNQIRNHNVVGVYDKDDLIAVYYFTEKAGRVIVKKNYRGKNLSVLLRMYFAIQSRWNNSSRVCYGWVGSSNISSKIAFERLFAVYTGKIKYRYIKKI